MILISGEALIDLIPDPERTAVTTPCSAARPITSRSGSRGSARRQRSCREFRPTPTAKASPRRSQETASISPDRARPKPTPLAFVMRGTAQTGSRYSFYLDATAFDGRWPSRPSGPQGARHLHVGSLAAVDPRHGESVVAALRLARERATTSFDPNIRPLVTPDRKSVAALVEREVCALPASSRRAKRICSGFLPAARSRTRSANGRGSGRDRGDARTSRRRGLSRRPAIKRNGAEGRGRRHRRRRRQFMSSLLCGDGSRRRARRRRAATQPSSVSKRGSPSPQRPRRSPAHAKAPIRRRSQK